MFKHLFYAVNYCNVLTQIYTNYTDGVTLICDQ